MGEENGRKFRLKNIQRFTPIYKGCVPVILRMYRTSVQFNFRITRIRWADQGCGVSIVIVRFDWAR